MDVDFAKSRWYAVIHQIRCNIKRTIKYHYIIYENRFKVMLANAQRILVKKTIKKISDN
jgi:hypothetical protein